MAFSSDTAWPDLCVAFDVQLLEKATTRQKLADLAKYDVKAVDSAEALARASEILVSLVTADQSLAAAKSVLSSIEPGCLFLDMNSVSPKKKMATAELIEGHGGRYVDIAIMAPVLPRKLSVPVWVSGPHADAACETLVEIGFSNVRKIGDEVGQAASIKMLRSIIIKGMEALTAECMEGAHAAGLVPEVLEALGPEWEDRANYNLERMLVHGERRAAEMYEVCDTLEYLGVPSRLSLMTARTHKKLGGYHQTYVPDDLTSKLSAIAGPGA